MHLVPCAFDFALLNAGSNIAAKIAMMAMTTSSSIKVKPGARRGVGRKSYLEFAVVNGMGLLSQLFAAFCNVRNNKLLFIARESVRRGIRRDLAALTGVNVHFV